MRNKKFLYIFNYNSNESDLCKFESKYLFDQEELDKLLFSDRVINPSSSAFIKKRLELTHSSKDYSSLLQAIKKANICIEGFKVEYLVVKGDETEYSLRLKKLKDIGYSIEGEPDYYNPTTTFALCKFKGIWHFGILMKNSFDWHKHKLKPHSYSNSISQSIAKALVNVASKGNLNTSLIDACCGAGTIMLEACFAGFQIDGCDINWKMCRHSRENLKHFYYETTVYRSDIKDITQAYDAAIIDLPYNIFSHSSDENSLHIIASTTKIAHRLVIVSTTNISHLIKEAGLILIDQCNVNKIGKGSFNRIIWVCER